MMMANEVGDVEGMKEAKCNYGIASGKALWENK